MRKRILIVSENFTKGGLETQINTTMSVLNNQVEPYYAVANYDRSWNLENIYTDFHFSYNSTVSEFCNDVNGLVDIIKKHKIEIVHVHPFYSFFPGVFAAKICKIPVVYTYHGLGSFNFPLSMIDNFLFNMLLDYEVDKIFSVAAEGVRIIQNIVFDQEKVLYLPNFIDTQKFENTEKSHNKSWALVSRLDRDKSKTIKDIMLILDQIGIEELHIYGSGTEEKYLKQISVEYNLDDKVFFEGYTANVYDDLKGKYCGIIGNGRAAMEGIAMGYPVILLGYKNSGLITREIYDNICKENFSGRNIPAISTICLKQQIESVYENQQDCSFYSEFIENYSAESVSQKYYDEIKEVNQTPVLDLSSLYDQIGAYKGEYFYTSQIICTVIKENLNLYIRSPHQKNIMLINNGLEIQKSEMYLLNEQLNKQLNNNVHKEVEQIQSHISYLYENSMTLSNIKIKMKRKIKDIKSRIRKKGE